jgi:predicted phosphodiesterase
MAPWVRTRRDFLKASGWALAGLAAGAPAYAAARLPRLSFGLVTDAHYAEAEAKGVRCYRASVTKMTECIALMNAKPVAFVVELGDFKDQGAPPAEKSSLAFLAAIEKSFREFRGPRYHVLGNHDTDTLSKAQFLAHVENTGIAQESSYYSFDAHGLHFVVLDANYNADGADYDHGKFKWTEAFIPAKELAWLKADLAATAKTVIVFVHQLLDGDDVHCVKNAPQVRQLLQASGKVLAVFQGHYHAGKYSRIEGIHYYTLRAMIEGSGAAENAYAIAEVHDNGDIIVTGYRRAVSQKLTKA